MRDLFVLCCIHLIQGESRVSENKPEWQNVPGADKGTDAGQPDQASYAGTQDPQAYNPYAQQDQSGYAQQAYPGYGQQDQAGYPAYAQQDQSGYPQQGGYPQHAGYPGYGQQAAYPAYSQPPVNPGQSMGLAALITSFFVPIVGLVLGIIGLNQSRKAGLGNGMAVAGIVVGGVFTLFIVLYIIVVVMIVAAAPEYSY